MSKEKTISCPECNSLLEYAADGGNYLCERCGCLWRKITITKRIHKVKNRLKTDSIELTQ